ncbi:MAG: hypothetical protein QM775_34320 [Pirellulales bacterium]
MTLPRNAAADRMVAKIDERSESAPPSSSLVSSAAPTTRQWAGLVATVCVVLVAWGVVLPRLNALPAVAEHIATQQRLEIDPAALFYTELKMSAGVAHRQERRLQDSADSFWRTATDRR